MERGKLAGRLGSPKPGGDGKRRMVEETHPAGFMAALSRAAAGRGEVFLINPAWRSAERAELARLPPAAAADQGWLMIPSGGAGGGVKFARHDGFTIAAAVEGFRQHFGLDEVNSVCVLPLHHVSGFMAWMRSALTGGRFIPWGWKDAEAGLFPHPLPDGCCLSLVPTQLQRLLASSSAVEWMKGFRFIFLGGAPAWEGLLAEAARLGLPLAPSYGATETAAMVTALRPEEFLAGRRDSGRPLPHAAVDIDEHGHIRVSGNSLFQGYYPSVRSERWWVSDDLGTVDAEGSLVVLGRSDDLIITGGKKVAPAEVEAALRSSGEFDDVAVIGVADPEWGQRVVACYPATGRTPRPLELEAALAALASFKHPWRYAAVAPWPRNDQGKIDRTELARLAARA